MKAALAATGGLLVALMLALVVFASVGGAMLTDTNQQTQSQSEGICVPAGQEQQTLPIPVPGGTGRIADLSEEQSENVRTIVQTARSLGVPVRGQVVAVATAMQESTLRNLDGGDRDSLGLFQQRPSQGWGTREQIKQPVYATTSFFQGATTNRGLLDIAGWESLPVTVAAQRTQRSGYPGAYAKHETKATAYVAAVGAAGGEAAPAPIPLPVCDPPAPTAAAGVAAVPAAGCPPTGLAAERGLTRDALNVMRCTQLLMPPQYGMGGNGPRPNDSDHGRGRAVDVMVSRGGVMPNAEQKAYGDQVAAFYQENASAFGITYIIWSKRIWSVARADEGWRPYTHPTGATGVTVDHYDHPHLSVEGAGGTIPSQ